MDQRLRLIVSVLISALFLGWAWKSWGGNVGDVATALRGADYWYVVPALVAYFAGVWLRAVRWHFLLRPVKPIPARRLFPVVVIGYMANDVLPARLGELVRAYVLGEQEGTATSTTLATIVVERLFDGLAMLIFVGVVATLVPLGAAIAGIVRVAAALFLGALLALFAVGSSRARAVALVTLFERHLPASLEGKVARLADRFLSGLDCLQSFRLSAAILVLSLGAWLCEATMYTLVARGFRLDLGFPAYMLTTAVANLMAMVPAAPGYLGTFELGALASLQLFGVARSAAAGYILVLHLALLAPVSLLGFYYLWRANLSLRTLRERAGAAPVEEVASP